MNTLIGVFEANFKMMLVFVTFVINSAFQERTLSITIPTATRFR